MSRVDGSLAASRRTWVFAAFLAAALVGAALGGTRLADVDVADGLWSGAGALSDGAARIRWAFVPVVAGLTVLHYLISALGVRATASGASASASLGGRLGLWEVTTTQLAGAAANRLAPAGLGSAAVTCRYLTRRGVPTCTATTTVAVVGLTRGLAKLVLLALVVALWNGLEHAVLPVARLGRFAAHHTAILVPGAVVVLLLAGLALCRRRRRRTRLRIGAAVVGVLRSLRHLLRRPRYLLASFATAVLGDIALALAFAVSVTAIPGAGHTPLGPLVAVYFLGATAGAAVPVPAGVGSTEAALIAALATVHVPAAQAAQGVLLFRVMTFWVPVPAGVLSTRWLRRRGGL